MYDHLSELTLEKQNLIHTAKQALSHAYAPYSGYHVGCSILMDNGATLIGNNQENRSFPAGLCAERNALFHAGKEGNAHLIRKIAIVAKSVKHQHSAPPMPCGSCRQVMLAYEQLANTPFHIYVLDSYDQVYHFVGVEKSLLPFSFSVEL